MLLLLACCCGLAWCQSSRSGIYQLQLSATPTQVPADGQSQSRLRVDMRDQSGRSVPDGTPFVAHTDLGLLGLSSVGRQASINGRTSGGFAILYVTSSEPGTATVTVQAADSRNKTYIDFLPEGEVASGQARVIDVTGGWVGYSMELGMVEARDHAKVRFGRLIIECAGVLQIDIEGLTLKAQDVVVRRGDAKLEGEDLYFDFATKRGVIRRFGEEKLERVFFDAIALRPTEAEWELPLEAFKLNKRETDTWLIARSVNFFVREKVVLRNAALWVQEQKVFTFPPYWIIGLPGYTGATNSQALGVTSSGGLAVDFPFFYRVTDKATGAIKIQRGARSSSVTSRDGWSIAIAEEYRNGNGTEGTLEVGGLPRSDWGFNWTDSRPLLGTGSSYLNFGMPDHKSIFGDATAYNYLANGRVSLRTYYDKPVDYDTSYGVVGDWLLDPRPIGDHNLSYRFGTALGWRRYSGEDSPVYTTELYSELNLGSRGLGRKTTLEPTFTNTYSWDSGGYHENAARGELRLEHRFSRNFNASLDYSAEYRSGSTEDDGLDQILGLNVRANHGAKWLSYLTSSYGLDDGDLYSFANFDYYLNRKWRWGLTGTYYDYESTDYKDLEISLGRVFGDREVSLSYSTDSGRVSVSLGGFSLK